MKPKARQRQSQAAQRDAEAARLMSRAQTLELAGKLREAAGVFDQATRKAPRNAGAWRELGRVLRDLEILFPSREALRKAVALDPKDADARLYLGRVLQRLGDGPGALAEYERAAWLRPDDLRAYCGLGVVHERLHDLDKAVAAVERGLDKDPAYPLAHVLRARLDRRRGDLEAARDRLHTLLARTIPDEARLRAAYELARVLTALGDHAGAFAAATEGNTVQAGTPTARAVYDTGFLRLLADQSVFTREHFERWGAEPVPDDGPPPILLVGFPRSGTTMTEQILGAHPELTVSNEQDILNPVLNRMFRDQKPGDPLPEAMASLTLERIAEARAGYRAAAAELVRQDPGKRRLVDKFPMNLGVLSFVNRVLPDAKVIVVHRDPRDVCLSCYVQEFVVNASMVHFHTLEDTARMYDGMMGLWLRQRELLTLDVLEIHYEDTVADLERQARRLMDFLDLEWSDELLRFHERDGRRYVSTPSYEAVSEPVHRKAQGKWKRHAERLAPILPRLEPFVEALGYEPTASALAAQGDAP
jgi:tetratricopeptide (TPR) repeat protein